MLWREDLLRCPTTLVLGGKDCLVNAAAIAAYVTKGTPEGDLETAELSWDWRDLEAWKGSLGKWVGEGLELVWLEGYDHGQAMLGKAKLGGIVHLIDTYCGIEEEKALEREDTASEDGAEVQESGAPKEEATAAIV